MTDQTVRHTLAVDGGLELTCSTRGATVCRLRVPFNGEVFDTVLSYPTPGDYESDTFYVGAMCGRYAGRIGNAMFTLNEQVHRINTAPNQRHALHGGAEGFNQRQWVVEPPGSAHLTPSLAFTLHSADGDQGFPGNLTARVTYQIVGKRTLLIDVTATCDQDTILNLVNHAYFNLNQNNAPIDNHRVQILADAVTVSDASGIPTGTLTQVADGPLDLRAAIDSGLGESPAGRALGDRQFDHNFVLSKPPGTMGLAAVVGVPEHGLALAVHSTLPGLQCYTGDQLHGLLKARSGLCLEAQQFPDAPNQSAFPRAVLRQGETFRSRTAYAFGALDDIVELASLSAT